MIVTPAIDIKDGRAVRLRQGVASDSTVYGNDPVEVAKRFVGEGARRLHVVDLDGAFTGKPVHSAIIGQIARLGVPLQIGGGVRDIDSLVRQIEMGVRWVILGTAAIKDRRFLEEALNRFVDQVVIGIDARDGKVRLEGWTETSLASPEDLARDVRDLGCQRVIYTNIATDGMLVGPDVEGLKRLAHVSNGLALTASGGVGDLSHIKQLKAIEGMGIESCIVGKAFYEGTLELAAAQEIAD